jgi:hypothetical protein
MATEVVRWELASLELSALRLSSRFALWVRAQQRKCEARAQMLMDCGICEGKR